MEFLRSFANVVDLPSDKLLEVCLLSRSNAGKSSLVNALAKRKIARVSKTPGCTQTINLYLFDSYKRIIDLPGYGYAKVNKAKFWYFNELLEDYINNRSQLAMVLQICDVNVITEQDITIALQLQNKRFQHVVILNKVDRLSKQQLLKAKENCFKKFYTNCFLIYISCRHFYNIDKVFQLIKRI